MPFLPTFHARLTFLFLYSHEIAFVFGQMSSEHSVPALIDVMRRDKEEDMVRHEAAEALGGIATDECLPILREFAEREDIPRVVRESCVVALDMVRSLLFSSRRSRQN
jgi:deoxyhypusine monooxygenase